MTWNHRVVEFPDGPGETILMICEVYYNDEGKPIMHNEGSRASGQDYTEIQLDIDRMAGAMKKPRLRQSDFVTK